jgi:two-component system NtrC family sensor kinase
MPQSILVVSDEQVARRLAEVADVRGLEVVAVATRDEALAAISSRSSGVAVVDVQRTGADGWALVDALRALDPSTEVIVIAEAARANAKGQPRDVFAVLAAEVTDAQLVSTVGRALERHRFTWELGLFNEVAEVLASSLDVTSVLPRAADRIKRAFRCDAVLIRLITETGDAPSIAAVIGVSASELGEAFRKHVGAWPSDRAIATRSCVRVDDVRDEPFAAEPVFLSFPHRSLLAAPIAVSSEVLGAVTIGSALPGRFSLADERLLRTIGQQLGVAASNGRLFTHVQQGKLEWVRTFDSIRDPIAVFDASHRTVRANSALAEMCGWTRSNSLGRTCGDIALCGGGCPDCMVARAARDGARIDHEIVRADGRIFALTVQPVPESGGEVVLVARDVSEERRSARQLHQLSQELQATNAELRSTVDRLHTAQAQLVQAEKLTALGQLVAGVAHELNNPLTSVIGYAQLVQEQLRRRREIASRLPGLGEDISLIVVEAERAARIVRNLLMFARNQTSRRTLEDAADLCERVVELRAYDLKLKGIEIETVFASDLPAMLVDGGQVQQALLNLLLNAEEAVREGQTRRIRIAVEAEAACGTVLIAVSDSGHGIEPANLSRVFDPFFTTKPVGEGTGLGLSIVHGIVRAHGGHVWVTSQVNRQTTFHIRLPACGDAGFSGGRAVLVAFADRELREAFSAMFAGWGFDVDSAGNPRETLERLTSTRFSLALVDQSVVDPDPEGWRQAWAARRSAVGLIGVLSGSPDEDAAKFLREEASAVLAPSVDLCALRRAVEAAADRAAPRGGDELAPSR